MPLDIGFGLMAAYLTAHLGHSALSWMLLLAGAVFAIIPDVDFPFEWLSKGTVGGKKLGFHRELTHYPLLYLPISLGVYMLWGGQLALLFSLCVIFHLLHDSVGMGWGVKWLWPFNRSNYKFFSDKSGEWSGNFVASWQPEELERTVAEHGDPDWIRNYLKSPTLALEIASFVLVLLFILMFKGF